MFAIAIKDLKVYLGNSNLLIKKCNLVQAINLKK